MNMNKYFLIGLCSLSLGLSLPAVATPERQVPVTQLSSRGTAAERAFRKLERMVKSLEGTVRALENPNLDMNDSESPQGLAPDLDTVKHLILTDKHGLLASQPGYANLVKRVYQLRQEYARMGLPISDWSTWSLSGRNLSLEEADLINQLEARFNQLHSVSLSKPSSVYAPELESVISQIRSTLDQPVFVSNPNLSDYRTMYASDLLKSYENLLQQKRLDYIQSQTSTLWSSLQGLDANDSTRIRQLQSEAADILNAISVMEKGGYSLPELRIKVQPDGTSSRVLSLSDARSILEQISSNPILFYKTQMHLAPQ